jgi:hypothetical protein
MLNEHGLKRMWKIRYILSFFGRRFTSSTKTTVPVKLPVRAIVKQQNNNRKEPT